MTVSDFRGYVFQMIVAELKENGADIHPVCSHLQAVCHFGVDVQMTAASVYGGKTRFLSWLPLAAPPPASNTTTTPAEPPLPTRNIQLSIA